MRGENLLAWGDDKRYLLISLQGWWCRDLGLETPCLQMHTIFQAARQYSALLWPLPPIIHPMAEKEAETLSPHVWL